MVLIIDQFEETRRSPPSGWVFSFFSPFFLKHHAPRSIIPFALSPLDLSRDLQPFPSNYLSRSNSILSLPFLPRRFGGEWILHATSKPGLYIISWSENWKQDSLLSRPISTPNGGYAAGPPIWNLFRFIGDGVCSPNIWLPRDIFPRRSEKIPPDVSHRLVFFNSGFDFTR